MSNKAMKRCGCDGKLQCTKHWYESHMQTMSREERARFLRNVANGQYSDCKTSSLKARTTPTAA